MLFAMALIAASFAVHAQEETRSNAIKLNPLSLVVATGNVAYERAVSSNQSIQIGGFYGSFSLSGLKYTGFGILPEYRIYFAGQKQALNGVYVAPFVRYQSFNLKDKETNDKASFNSFGGGATIGWQKMWNGGFVLNLFAGPSYSSGKIKSTDGSSSEFDVKAGIDGFGIRSGISLGFGF
jgi:hypothetical protein